MAFPGYHALMFNPDSPFLDMDHPSRCPFCSDHDGFVDGLPDLKDVSLLSGNFWITDCDLIVADRDIAVEVVTVARTGDYYGRGLGRLLSPPGDERGGFFAPAAPREAVRRALMGEPILVHLPTKNWNPVACCGSAYVFVSELVEKTNLGRFMVLYKTEAEAAMASLGVA